jgi:hypothetical protein
MEDIIIAGYSINALKAQKAAIREGASKVIAESIEAANKLTEQLLESEDVEEINALAQQAVDLLETAEVVAGVSGVSFFLPFYEEYGQYDSHDIFSKKLEGSDNEALQASWYDFNNVLGKLYSQYERMESDSRGWYSSTC